MSDIIGEPRDRISRWQAYVWAESVLLPITRDPVGAMKAMLYGRPSDRANLDQVCRYFPEFREAVEGYEMEQTDIDALVSAAWKVEESLPGPTGHFDLAFGYDDIERKLRLSEEERERAVATLRVAMDEVDGIRKQLERSRELEESAKAVTRKLQEEVAALRLQPHAECPVVEAVLREGGELPAVAELERLRARVAQLEYAGGLMAEYLKLTDPDVAKPWHDALAGRGLPFAFCPFCGGPLDNHGRCFGCLVERAVLRGEFDSKGGPDGD